MTKEEAIKRIKDWNLDDDDMEVLSTFIPELKESEDEKIRKWIRKELESKYVVDNIVNNEMADKAFAWLKKQGDRTTDKIIERARTEKQRVLLTETNGDAHIDWNCRNLQDVKLLLKYGLEYIDTQLEKQGEQKSEEEVDNPHNYLYGEQKPANKVEPKFKVGNWVVYCNEDVDLITGIEEKGYRINEGGYIPFACEDNMRLWTIKDAKDGDVLTSQYDKPFIYNGNRNSSHIGAYCGVTTEDSFYVATKKCYWSENTDVYPATQEQRDLLFTKMKEAGYEWDTEDKVLRKIEPKPAWSEEDESKFKFLHHLLEQNLEHHGSFRFSDIKELGYVTKQEALDMLKSLKERMQLV